MLTKYLLFILAAAHSVTAGLTGCPKNLAFQLTNVFQIGQIKFQYGNCGVDNTGNGYAAGIANFCTGTGDAWQVIQAYHNLTGGNDEFTKYDSVLKQYAEDSDGSTDGLDGFCNAWQQASASQKFWSAQGTVFDRLYFTPSQDVADGLGLQLSVSQAQMYDAALTNGAGSNKGSLKWMVNKTNKGFVNDKNGDSGSTLNINGTQVDEIVWLKAFLDVRENNLAGKGNMVNVESYRYIINQTEYVWTHDLQVLNNKGQVGDVTCDHTYLPGDEPLQNTPPATSNDDNEDGMGEVGDSSSGALAIISTFTRSHVLAIMLVVFFFV